MLPTGEGHESVCALPTGVGDGCVCAHSVHAGVPRRSALPGVCVEVPVQHKVDSLGGEHVVPRIFDLPPNHEVCRRGRGASAVLGAGFQPCHGVHGRWLLWNGWPPRRPRQPCSPEEVFFSHTNIRRWNTTTTKGVAVRFTVCARAAAWWVARHADHHAMIAAGLATAWQAA